MKYFQVKNAFVFTEFFAPAKLPQAGEDVAVDSTAVVSGWGYLGGVSKNLIKYKTLLY